MSKLINFNLADLAEGGVQEKLDRAVKEVAENITNPNFESNKKRQIIMTMSFNPDKKRQTASVEVEVRTKLAPENGVDTTILLGRDDQGYMNVNELKSGVKGQTYFDDQGEMRTDTGDRINSDGKVEEKVIDLQKKKVQGDK